MTAPEVHEALAEVLAHALVQRMTWPSMHWKTQSLDLEAARALAKTAIAELAKAGYVAPDHFAEAVTEARARELREAADAVAGSFPYNGELLPDGREDPLAAQYVAGLHDAHDLLRARADSLAPEAPSEVQR